jgi:hypothetical protein
MGSKGSPGFSASSAEADTSGCRCGVLRKQIQCQHAKTANGLGHRSTTTDLQREHFKLDCWFRRTKNTLSTLSPSASINYGTNQV